ncbi:MAG: hypothetical protein JNM84_05075 [Planctomycetes bacterium]|nr:hypothetical protein [Planctomycetota bacterium]
MQKTVFALIAAALIAAALWLSSALAPRQEPSSSDPLDVGLRSAPSEVSVASEELELRRDRSSFSGAEPATPEAASASVAPRTDDLRVCVIDRESGRRLGDLPVRLRWVAERAGVRAEEQIELARPSGEELELRIPKSRVEASRERHGDGALFATVVGLFAAPPERRIELASWPAEPVEIRLPLHGNVQIVVHDEAENRIAVDGAVRVRAEAPTLGRATMELRLHQGSSERIACELGFELAIEGTLENGAQLEQKLARGPETTGETRTIALQAKNAATILLLRPLAPPGKPLPERKFQIALSEKRQTASMISTKSIPVPEAVADADGWLRIELKDPSGGNRLVRTMIVSLEDRQSSPLAVMLDLSREFPSGETSFGEVLLGEEPLIVSGEVVDASGRPLSNLNLGLELWKAKPEQNSTADQILATQTDQEGRFQVRGFTSATIVVIEERSNPYLSGSKLEFPIGRSDVHIELARGASLRGSVHVPDDMDPTGIHLHLFAADAADENARPVAFGSVSENGSFSLEGIPPGKAHVLFRSRAAVKLGGVRDLVFEQGIENRDPRAQAIPLCVDWRPLSLELVRHDNQPLTNFAFELSSVSGYREHARTNAKGQCKLWLPPTAKELSLRSPAFRALDFTWSEEHLVLRLRDGIRVTVPVEVTLISPIRGLRFSLVGADGRRGAASDLLQGKVELVVPEPGRYTLSAGIVMYESGSRLDLLSPPVLEVVDAPQQSFPPLRITEAELRAALDGGR